jgi:putative membrane protein
VSAQPDQTSAEVVDATRRTRLAAERTELAWWRTGLTALAVALGVGRVVPELNHGHARWPYVIAGVGFAIWGIVAIAYGSARGSAVGEDLSRGHFHQPPDWVLGVLTGGGVVLGAITAVLILLD